MCKVNRCGVRINELAFVGDTNIINYLYNTYYKYEKIPARKPGFINTGRNAVLLFLRSRPTSNPKTEPIKSLGNPN